MAQNFLSLIILQLRKADKMTFCNKDITDNLSARIDNIKELQKKLTSGKKMNELVSSEKQVLDDELFNLQTAKTTKVGWMDPAIYYTVPKDKIVDKYDDRISAS